MTREKKKISYAELEEHVSAWVFNQIELLRCAVDEISDDDQMEREHRIMLFDGIALQFMELLELISKVNHDSKHIIDWCQNFINKNKLPDPEPLEI